MATAPDRVLYHEGDILVSQTHVRVADQTHRLDDVDSVSLLPPILRRSYGVVALVAGVLLAVLGYLVWAPLLLTPILAGAALALVGLVLTLVVRTRYTVRLHVRSGAVVPLYLEDRAQAQQIVAAITRVIGQPG